MRPSLLVVAPVVLLAVVLFGLERVRPLRHPKSALLPRLGVNAVVTALAMITAGLAVRPITVELLGRTEAQRLGLVAAMAVPAPLSAALSFLLLDLSFYYWHRANHRWPPLWRFHNVHHLDPDLDVSTSLRFHFGEVALSAGFRALQVIVIGPSVAAYLAYELVFHANTLFHHSNVRLPVGTERTLAWLLVSPRMHGIHHSHVQGETNSNYSVVFPWWDRLHRTLVLGVPQREVTIGVPGYSAPGDNRLLAVLALPFRRQLDYWGDRARPPRVTASSRTRMAE